MPALRSVAMRGRTLRHAVLAMFVLGVTNALLAGCGKSKTELAAEKAAADARYDAAVEAEQERERKLERAAEQAPVEPSRPAQNTSPAFPALARVHADRQRSISTVPHDDSASSGDLSDSELHERYQQIMGNLRNNLPQSDTTRFYEANMNREHNAICGSVDYEVMTNGVKSRSKRQRFMATMSDAIVDTDAPGVHETFQRMATSIDCSSGFYRDPSQYP